MDAGLLVIGDDRYCIARLLFRGDRRLLQEFHRAVDAQDFRHLLCELRVAAFQVVTHLVWLHLLLVEDLAHRALDQLAEADVPLRRCMLARVAGQKPRRQQFVGMSDVLCKRLL